MDELFHSISLADKPLFDRYLPLSDSRSSGSSFGNIYLWDILCRRYVAEVDGWLCVEFQCRSGPFYAFPLGQGDPAQVLERLCRRSRELGQPFSFHGVTVPERALLEGACPGRFAFIDDRDNYDYVYSLEAMATLAGKKLHGKRNHCNRFEATYDWRFEPLTPALFDDCRALLTEWDAEKEGGDPEENRAISILLDNWDALGMEGGVLYADGAPAAFTVGELLTEDTMDVHFEKAREDVDGAYPMVAREFARLLTARHPALRYLNREEDMGAENLRRAKESWYPLFLIEKYIAVERDAP